MCGRYTLTIDKSTIERRFGAKFYIAQQEFEPAYNAAPSRLLPIIRTYHPDCIELAKLAIYALALTRRVPGLRLFDIKCAWFNEQEYCEIFPRTLFVGK